MKIFFIDIHLIDFVDILLVAALLFFLYKLIKGTVAINIFLGLVSLFILWKIVDALQMELLSQILGAFISVGLVALIIIFQPEIRQFLLAVGTTNFFKNNSRFALIRSFFSEQIEFDIDSVVVACMKMSEIKEGALIVVTRQNELQQYVRTGHEMNATISALLIENIFFKNSPLHDGAMIISNNKIMAAACILPVTKKKVEGNAGLRHRAAIGITEISDSIAIVVSEETGRISYCIKGEVEFDIVPRELQEKLVIDLELQNDK